MFVTIMFSARISGSHYNPCITFSYMVGNVQHANFNRILGLLYMVAQILGAFIGAMFATQFAEGVDTQMLPINVDSHDILQTIVVETCGSFFLVFMYLSSTDKDTKFTDDAAIQTIILSGSYLGGMLLGGAKIAILKASPVNPAIALCLILWNVTKDNLRTCWVFILAPFLGSFLALLFFRFIYQKTTKEMAEEEDEVEEAERQEALLE